MSRGDVVLVALPGDYGKPRPAVVIQSDRLSALASVVVCPLTTDLAESTAVRLRIVPSADNGLRAVSDIMTDKIHTVPRSKLGEPVGRLDTTEITMLDDRLALLLGLSG